MGGTFILGLSIFFKTTAIGKFLAWSLKVAAIQMLSRSLTKGRQSGSDPVVGQNLISIQAPYPPRQICYGDAWVAPQIVWARNGNNYVDSGSEVASTAPRSAIMTYAVCDHPIECWEFQMDGVQFLGIGEQRGIKDSDGLFALGWNYKSAIVETRYDEGLEREVREFKGEENVSKLRQRVNDRRDTLRWGYKRGGIITTKFRGNVSADTMTSDTQKVDFDFGDDAPDWNEISFGKLADNCYSYGRLNIQNSPHSRGDGGVYLRGYGQGDARRYWFYRENTEGGYTQHDMHFYGTAMMEIVYAARSVIDKDFVWGSPPNILLGVRRPRESLTLWDDTQPGAPKIDAKWSFNNAALCAYDYIMRYTDYGVPICGESRVNLQSVAKAAAVCHRERLFANGTINLDNAPFNVFKQFEYAMGGGDLSEVGGVLFMNAGEDTPPTYGYDDDEILEGSWNISPSQPRESRPGLIDYLYTDRNGERQEALFKHPRASENLSITENHLVFINNFDQAKRIAHIENHRAWDAAHVEFGIRADVPTPRVWDTITINIDRIGRLGVYRVLSTEFNPEDGSTAVTAVAERAGLYITPTEAEYIPPSNRIRRGRRLMIGEGSATPGRLVFAGGDAAGDNLLLK